MAYTAPGVYIEEISSGIRTITGVSTSIAAFVGWAPMGPTDEARRVLSWGDYNRAFGGLHSSSLMSYAVSHFFSNGGSDAYIVRIADDDSNYFAKAKVGDLEITANGPGEWANNYRVKITQRIDEEADTPGAPHFTLTVSRKLPGAGPATDVEVFSNLSMDPNDARYVHDVVSEQSQYINASTPPNGGNISDTDPDTDGEPLADGENGTIISPIDDPNAFMIRAYPEEDADKAVPRGGVYHLDRVDLFNLLCVPGLTDSTALGDLAKFCKDRRAFLIADADRMSPVNGLQPIGGDNGTNAAIYHPWVKMPDPLKNGLSREFPPCGVVAGVYARTDASRGVWKAPAGIDASLSGVRALKATFTEGESGILNQKGVNALRSFPVYGPVVWGARTCRGSDEIGSEWKYVPVRRTALFIEETLRRSLRWVVFEPNDEPLWAQIRLNVGAFMHDQFRKGAFQGSSPREAYYVRCDRDTTTQNDINMGIVNILVGFAPLKPAEFVVIQLQQMVGQVQT